jgi:hypothetical protein
MLHIGCFFATATEIFHFFFCTRNKDDRRTGKEPNGPMDTETTADGRGVGGGEEGEMGGRIKRRGGGSVGAVNENVGLSIYVGELAAGSKPPDSRPAAIGDREYAAEKLEKWKK